jgi:hypothetical protein
LTGEATEIQSVKASRPETKGDIFTAILRLSRDCLATFVAHYHSDGEWFATVYGLGVKAVLSLSAMRGQGYFDTGETFPVPVNLIDVSYKPGLYTQDRAFLQASASREKLTYLASDLGRCHHELD